MSSLERFPQICRDISKHLKPVRDRGIVVAFQPNFPRKWGEAIEAIGDGILRIVFLECEPLKKTGVSRIGGEDRITLLLHFALGQKFFEDNGTGSIELLSQVGTLLQGFKPNEWCGLIQLGTLRQNQPIGDYWIFEQQIQFNAIAQPSQNAPINKEPLLLETIVNQSIQ
ncbi:MAG: hypothetical protein J7647_26205 [Cyanobacteria bacterium SBLK]|nr:hypothetical protein [Cyanobacteria bacterium SBLK]